MPLAIGVVPSVDSVVMASGLAVAAAVDQVVPPSVLYCQPVIAEPPSLASATATVSDPVAASHAGDGRLPRASCAGCRQPSRRGAVALRVDGADGDGVGGAVGQAADRRSVLPSVPVFDPA